MEYDKNEIYEKYKNMVYKLSIQALKKNLHTTTYKIDDLINVAWIAVIDSFRTFKNDKGAEIETYIYNNINFKLKDFIRFNIYSVYVPNSTLFNLNHGYDRIKYLKEKKKMEKDFKKGLITQELLNKILQDIKDKKINNIYEFKEYKNNDSDNNYHNDIFGHYYDNEDYLFINLIEKLKVILIDNNVCTDKDIQELLRQDVYDNKNVLIKKIKAFIKDSKLINLEDFEI